MIEMRKCKECGKLFHPKGREKYCSDIHYRPCPICGTPVEAKYLSDPPRRCNNCKSKSSAVLASLVNPITIENTNMSENIKSSEVSTTPSDIPIGKDIRKYVGDPFKGTKGFVPDHLYELSIMKYEYHYWITATYDWTENKEVNILGLFSSKISVEGHFEKLEQCTT